MILKNRVALVTGGSHGIGKSVVRRLLEEGARVAFCARDIDGLQSAAAELAGPGREIYYRAADVTSPDQVRELVADTQERFGTIDILVNNAGVYGPIGPAWENDVTHWEATLDVNVVGVFRMCRAVIPIMIANGGGKIVNMSGGGAATPFPRFSAYAVSKVAVVRFTETLAQELVPHNIQVNAIAPGFVATRLHQDVIAVGEAAGEDFLRKTKDLLEHGGADPALAAGLIAFLASDRADRISGKFFAAVWDGWAEFEQHLDEIAGTDIYTLRRIVPADRGMSWK